MENAMIALTDDHLDAVAGGCMGRGGYKGHGKGYPGGWPRLPFGPVQIQLTIVKIEDSTLIAGDDINIAVADQDA